MSATTKPTRKKFRVAVSGATVDGREIRPDHLRDAAASYSPDVYCARVNVEHYLSLYSIFFSHRFVLRAASEQRRTCCYQLPRPSADVTRSG